MKNFKIVFLDIDGTTVTPEDTIQESTKEAVKQLLEQNIEVFLATGRPLHEIAHIADELNIQSFIGYNGAYAKHKGQDLLKETMPAAIIEEYLTVAKVHKQEIVMYTSEQNALTSDPSTPSIKHFIKAFHLKQNTLYTPSFRDKILGMTLLGLDLHHIPLYEIGEIHLSQVNVEGQRRNYDVIRDRVNKGMAVKKVLDTLHIPIESSVAFGDGMNDKEMLKTVGEGFAMENAHPDLFQYAKHKTTSVTESGIFNGLKSIGLVH